MAHNRGICGSASIVCWTPLIFICGMEILRRDFSFLQCSEIGGDILAIGAAGKVDQHFGAVHEPGRVGEKLIPVRLAAGDVRLFDGGGEAEPGSRSALAADDAGERRPVLVDAGLRRLSCRAAANTLWPVSGLPPPRTVDELTGILIGTRVAFVGSGFIGISSSAQPANDRDLSGRTVGPTRWWPIRIEGVRSDSSRAE